MTRLGLVSLLLVGGSSLAVADSDTVPGISEQAPGITPEGALAPISVVEGPGWKVGEGTVLHPIIGMETGFVSNVFYDTSDEDPKAAGVLRLIAQIGTGSLSPQRLAAGGEGTDNVASAGSLQYRLDARLSYEVMLSGDDQVQDQGGLGAGLLFRGVVFPKRTWSFLYLENFQRVLRATNFESSQQTNRDINTLQLGLQFAPQGRSISGLLHYENTLDYFEDDDQQFANRMHHQLGVTVSWRWRPMTVFFGDVTGGYFTGFGDSTKVDSMPLSISGGVQTLLTLNTTVIARIGYTNGFYDSGPSYSALLAGVQFGYRYSPRGRVTFLYDYNHQDSINANFYRDHHFRMEVEQQVVPFTAYIAPEVRLRRYEGIMSVLPGAQDTRDDVIFAVGAGARYNFRDWFAGVLEYRLSSVSTDYTYMVGSVPDDPSYVRHEIVAGVRAAL